MNAPSKPPRLSRRACLPLLATALAAPAISTTPATAQGSKAAFDQWVAAFRARALTRGISDAT
jgi:membrane-bound lytic murein transglycosylase B